MQGLFGKPAWWVECAEFRLSKFPTTKLCDLNGKIRQITSDVKMKARKRVWRRIKNKNFKIIKILFVSLLTSWLLGISRKLNISQVSHSPF